MGHLCGSAYRFAVTLPSASQELLREVRPASVRLEGASSSAMFGIFIFLAACALAGPWATATFLSLVMKHFFAVFGATAATSV